MSHGHTDQDTIAHTHNTARFFTETRHISWIFLIFTMLWGVYGYLRMPQRKDPDIPIRQALALVPWPGASAERIEQLVTRKVEEKIGENARVEKIESNTRTGLTAIFITLVEGTRDVGKEFDDIKLKLDAIHDLPDGAGPINFVKDFGDTAGLMLTVASSKIGAVEIKLRAQALQQAIQRARGADPSTARPEPFDSTLTLSSSKGERLAQDRPVEGRALRAGTQVGPYTSGRDAAGTGETSMGAHTDGCRGGPACPPQRVAIAHGLPSSIPPAAARPAVDLFIAAATTEGLLRDARILEGPGFVGLDAATDADDATIEQYVRRFLQERLRASEMHPDAWTAIVIRDPAETAAKLQGVAGDKYSYRELDDYTELITRTLKTLPIVSKVSRSGLLDERVFLEYSQERLASYGVTPGQLSDVLASRNITTPGGVLEVGGKNLKIDPSGEFKDEQEIGDVLVPTGNGRSVYLRDLAAVGRGYVSPPTFLNFFGAKDPGDDIGQWRRSRAITIAVQMRAGQQIAVFGKDVDATLARLKKELPDDLILARTSDQPRQVTEQIDLFMSSLYEAVILVVLVSLIGFWEWRSALLMALSIPITLGMTFGMMFALGIDLQQVSIASLIIALGLLVDDPVVAGDAIKRDLALGHPPIVAAWLGPTKLATAILFATITNIVAYVPFMFIPGDTGTFLYSLPVVIGASLVASRIVSMTFIPLLGYYILKPRIEARRKSFDSTLTLSLSKGERLAQDRSWFAAAYYRFGRFAIRHRWAFLASMVMLMAGGSLIAKRLQTQFFPKDLQYLSWVDVWLPEDAPLSATQQATLEAEAIVREVTGDRLRSLTTFVGGGGPRFWLSASPEQSQLNYAQILMEMNDKHDTNHLAEPLQHALSARVAGARVDVRLLEVGAAVGIPISIRVSGEDIPTLRGLAAGVTNILRAIPTATRIRDNWGPESFSVQLKTDSDRANMSGLTNIEIAGASATAMNGSRMTVLREGDKQIPVVARMRMEERAELSDIRNLYVYSSKGRQKVPLESVTSIDYGMHTEKLQRRNQFRTITISSFPADNVLASQVLNEAMPGLRELERSMPPGYRMEIGGEYEEQTKGFKNLAVVMLISVTMIFLALVVQFKHAIKPFIVFAAIPFGVMGALISLWIMGTPFGFMAFLGVASLIGVIVSHIIVLFDFIEEMHAEGKPLEEALLDAGIVRLRPVLITVAATVIALFPLAAHGGPLWEPMCYTQIGGLTIATFVTLLVVPVLYATFVLDLKLVKWETAPHHTEQPAVEFA